MCMFMYVAFGLPLMGCWLFDIFINSWYFLHVQQQIALTWWTFILIFVTKKKPPLKSLIDILNIDTVCSKCLHWHTMMPSEDLYMILEDHTPGFKRASFIWRIKKCQNTLGAGFHGDKREGWGLYTESFWDWGTEASGYKCTGVFKGNWQLVCQSSSRRTALYCEENHKVDHAGMWIPNQFV